MNRAPQGINRPIPIEITYNSKDTPPPSERQKQQEKAPTTAQRSKENPWNLENTAKAINKEKETKNDEINKNDMLQLMKKEMDKMWDDKMEKFKEETVKSILEPLKEHTDKKIEALQKHLEEFISALHLQQKPNNQWAQGLTKLRPVDRSGKSSGRSEK